MEFTIKKVTNGYIVRNMYNQEYVFKTIDLVLQFLKDKFE